MCRPELSTHHPEQRHPELDSGSFQEIPNQVWNDAEKFGMTRKVWNDAERSYCAFFGFLEVRINL